MKNWRDLKTKEELKGRYASYIPALQKIAGQHGYALAVHGSMTRDLDLIAVPWVKKVLAPETLVMSLQESLVGYYNTRQYWKNSTKDDKKPHGRKAYIIWIAYLADDFEGTSLGMRQTAAMIDLSIVAPIS